MTVDERTATSGSVTDDPTSSGAERPARRGIGGALLRSGVFRSLVSLVVGLGLWELVGRYVITDRVFFVPFSDAITALFEGVADGTLLTDLRVSAIELSIGYVLAVVIGVTLGVIMGLLPTVRTYLVFWVDAFNATPIIALAPIFVLMLGIGLQSKIAFVAFVSVWSILLNTMQGFMYPDAGRLEMVRSFGATPWQEFRTVRVPDAIPSVAVGLRISMGHGVVGIVVGELFGSSAGLGYELFAARDQFNIAGLFAAIIVLAVIGIVVVRLMGLLERRLSRWRD